MTPEQISQILDEDYPRQSWATQGIREGALDLGYESASWYLGSTYLKKRNKPVQRLLDKVFPEKEYAHIPSITKSVLRRSRRLLDAGDEEGAVAAILGDYSVFGGEPPNFKPPAKVTILAQSRDFGEFPIVQAQESLQEKIYGLDYETFLEWKKAYTDLRGKDPTTLFTNLTGVDLKGIGVQALNAIFGRTFSTYEGVSTKVENRNAKKLKKLKAKNRESNFVLETAYNDDGTLINPPGINTTIQCVQGFSALTPLHSWLTKKHRQSVRKRIPELRAVLEQYAAVDPEKPLPVFGHDHRLRIPKGHPGYIPDHDREGLVAQKRIRLRQGKNTNRKPGHPKYKPPKNRRGSYTVQKIRPSEDKYALPVVITLGEDWVVVDVRGLLRNARWRGLLPEGGSLVQLLALFSGDPVLDTGRRHVLQKDKTRVLETRTPLVTYSYGENVVPVRTKEVVEGERSLQKVILGAVEKDKKKCPKGEEGKVGLLSVDLGVTNPVAAKIYTVTQENGVLAKHQRGEPVGLPEDILLELDRYKVDYTAYQRKFEVEALEDLDPEYRAAFETYELKTPLEKQRAMKAKLCKALGIEESDISWSEMQSRSTLISDHLLDHGLATEDVLPANCFISDDGKMCTRTEEGLVVVHPTGVFRQGLPKKGKEGLGEVFKASDKKWYDEVKPRVPKEARDAWRVAVESRKRGHGGYQKFNKRAEELCSRGVNILVRKTKKRTGSSQVVVVLEDLGKLDNRMWAGSGKREPGWQNFVSPKSESRWFVQGLHRTFCELVDKGHLVGKVNPYLTSQACPKPKCGRTEPGSRSKVDREKYLCLHCGYEGHADFDVAAHNIAKVAITGSRLRKSESLNSEETQGVSRKSGKSKVSAHPPVPISDKKENKKEQGPDTSRNLVYKSP